MFPLLKRYIICFLSSSPFSPFYYFISSFFSTFLSYFILRSLSFYAEIPLDITCSNISQFSPQSHKISLQKKKKKEGPIFQFT